MLDSLAGLLPTSLELAQPWLLLLAIPGLALVFWRYSRKRGLPTLVYPSTQGLKGLPRTLRQRLAILVPALEALVVILLVAAVARPRSGDSRSIVRNEGIAIQMVVDISGSMEQEMTFDDRNYRRIDIVKNVFAEFVAGTKDGSDADSKLSGRKGDHIGLTAFARLADVNCPLIGDHEQLLSAVERLEPVPAYLDKEGREIPNDLLPTRGDRAAVRAFRDKYDPISQHPQNGTAIGDGLMRAVLSMITAEDDLAAAETEGAYKIKSKVIILLTDGENNAGERTPIDAGQYAQSNDIRVYYIVFREPYEIEQSFFRRIRREIPVDTILEEPRKVAGSRDRAFLAKDGDGLRRIYREIDEMERTEIGRIEYRSYNELFNWLLVPGLVLAALALLLGETIFRRTP